MFRFLKSNASLETVICPNCLLEQTAPAKALSIYCKNCRTRIDIHTLKQKAHDKDEIQRWKPKTKTITCPLCHSLQDVLANALSAYCKNCNQRINIKEEVQAKINEPIVAGNQREIICPHCGTHEEVPSTALSSFCPDCGNRINLQNYEIRGRFRGDLNTKGTVFISDDGFVEGNISTGSVIIAGKFKGEINAEEKVKIQSTGKLFGNVRAPLLSVSSGSTFVGHLHIGRV